MLQQISWVDLLEWEAYAQIEPFDETRDDYRFASVREAIYNVQRDTKKHPQPFPIKDFVIPFGEASAPTRRQTWQEQKAILMAIAYAYTEPKKKPTPKTI